MFGYVRPLKSELLVREFSRYRSVYCGICKSISHDYGQVPRLTVGYDLTLLALLLLSLSDEQPAVAMASCALNPVQKKPIVQGGDIIERCAALSVMLGYHKARDNYQDEAKVKGLVASALLRGAYRKARNRFGASDAAIRSHLSRLSVLERGAPAPALQDQAGAGPVNAGPADSNLAAAGIFGDLLADVMQAVVADSRLDGPVRAALVLFARHLGAWIYLCDAIDDLEKDCNNGNWNPFSGMDPAAARTLANERMQAAEQAMDRTAALLPYARDAGIIANVVTLGLPATRETILAGGKLGRL